jgi:flagellar assembly protein FliH
MMNSSTNHTTMRTKNKHEFEPMFGDGSASPATPRRKILTEEDLAAAKAEGFAEGVAHTNEGHERATSESLRAIANLMQMTLGRLSEEAQSLREDAAEIALTAAKVIAGSALDAFGDEAVADIVSKAVEQLRDAPRLVVRVAPELAETIEGRLIDCARQAGFYGEIVVRGDPDAASGDCNLDWGDGAITHNRAAAFEIITQAGQDWLASAKAEGFQINMFQS